MEIPIITGEVLIFTKDKSFRIKTAMPNGSIIVLPEDAVIVVKPLNILTTEFRADVFTPEKFITQTSRVNKES